MKKQYYTIFFALVTSLFIYLFYRTEHTIVNKALISLISFESYLDLKKTISLCVPLNSYVIYSLPEGLWVFSFALVSKNLFIKIGNLSLHLVYISIVFALGLELLQLFHIVNGQFDILDVLTSLLFWLLAHTIFNNSKFEILNLFNNNQRTILFLFTYCIVYLAHVSN